MDSGATVNMPANGNRVLVVKSIALSGTAKLDLFDNDLMVDYTGASPLSAIQALINTARNGGDWLGASGITSTTARTASPQNTTLGAMEGSEYIGIYGGGAQFDGNPVDSTAVLVKYTYYGDSDHNGMVEFDDYVRVDAGFNGGLTGWVNGDFDGNGIVDFDDTVLIDLGYNSQGAAL
jgi:hypothetical protein